MKVAYSFLSDYKILFTTGQYNKLRAVNDRSHPRFPERIESMETKIFMNNEKVKD